MPTSPEQRREIDANYDFFQRKLNSIIPDQLGRFAVLKNQEILGFFDKPGEAYRYAVERFGEQGYSIQEVTEEPIDLGFYSHVAS